MSRPRLLFIAESGTDVRLVEGLAEHFELSIIAREIAGGRAINWPPSVDVPTTIGPAGRAAFAQFVFRQLIHRKDEFDIALVQGYSLAALAANASRQFTSKPLLLLVCSPVEAYYRCRLTHPNGRPYQQHEATLLKFVARANAMAAAEYVVLSRHLEDVVRRHGARRVHRIPLYGVNTQLFAPPLQPKSDLRKQLQLPPDGTLIFFSSRIAPEKDSETLLRAVRRLLDSGHNLWLLHRSGGYHHFQRDAESFGVLERVIATDAVHPHRQLPLDYQACDICVQASREEGLGFSPLEALASGTPVIATAVGGLKETIIDGQTGWTYPAGDDAKLAMRIADVVLNPAEARRRALNGRQLVVEHFDRPLVFRQFAELVRKITGHNSQEVRA
ncbi:MAG: glycosyltransferase family 4 protein [Terriglobales bacterium]